MNNKINKIIDVVLENASVEYVPTDLEIMGESNKTHIYIPDKVKSKVISKISEILEEEDEFNKLSKLKNWGGECNCDRGNRETIKHIHEGNFDEIFVYCIKCGGICGDE